MSNVATNPTRLGIVFRPSGPGRGSVHHGQGQPAVYELIAQDSAVLGWAPLPSRSIGPQPEISLSILALHVIVMAGLDMSSKFGRGLSPALARSRLITFGLRSAAASPQGRQLPVSYWQRLRHMRMKQNIERSHRHSRYLSGDVVFPGCHQREVCMHPSIVTPRRVQCGTHHNTDDGGLRERELLVLWRPRRRLPPALHRELPSGIAICIASASAAWEEICAPRTLTRTACSGPGVNASGPRVTVAEREITGCGRTPPSMELVGWLAGWRASASFLVWSGRRNPNLPPKCPGVQIVCCRASGSLQRPGPRLRPPGVRPVTLRKLGTNYSGRAHKLSSRVPGPCRPRQTW